MSRKYKNPPIPTEAVEPIQASKVQDPEKIKERIDALKSLSGLLSDLTPEQMKIFKEAIKRRPLFG